MEFFLSLFSMTVLAAESLISPLPAGGVVSPPPITKPVVSFSQLPIPLPSPTPTAIPRVLGSSTDTPALPPKPETLSSKLETLPRKRSYTIALLGDSMVDTLGPDIPHLYNELHRRYPTTGFTLLNYGVGGTNIDYGLERITHDYTYLGTYFTSLAYRKPDIVVVESFGYNPYSYDTGAIDRHWMMMAKVVDTLRVTIPGVKIIIAATIAPSARVFGDGAAMLSYDAAAKAHKVNVIKQYLESTVSFARGEHLPLADAYHPSLDGTGNGKEVYIDGGDHIHYSDKGRGFFAQIVANAITTNRLLE